MGANPKARASSCGVCGRRSGFQTIVWAALLVLLLGGTPAAAKKGGLSVGLLVSVQGLGDQSYNDMTYAGLVRARQAFGITISLEHTRPEEAAIEAAMRRLIDSGVDVVVANGFYFSSAVNVYARRFPERYFIIQDAVIRGVPNVAAVTYAVEEGSFLAGALAAMMTHTGAVGFIGGVDIPIMQEFRRGYLQGALYINPKLPVWSDFLSKGSDLSGFNNPAAAFDLAMTLYNSGVDIIYAAAGVSGNGVIRAARKSDRFAIGVDSDQDHLAKGHVLTSMMKRLDETTFQEIDRIVKGRFQAGVKNYGLKAGGIGLTKMKYTRHLISDAVRARLDVRKKEIIAGKIRVAR
ncbi:MAG: BMP family ABC transporter substrate-binding protein [Desulfosarcinaceae bacterium]